MCELCEKDPDAALVAKALMALRPEQLDELSERMKQLAAEGKFGPNPEKDNP